MPMAHLPTYPVLTYNRPDLYGSASSNRYVTRNSPSEFPCPELPAISIECGLRFIVCQDCDGEGRRWHAHFSHWDPPEDVDAGPCPTCEGTGYEVVEVESLSEEEFLGREWRPIEGIDDVDA